MFIKATDLANDPTMTAAPAILVPPLGVEGRSVLLGCPPKGGKSTTAAGLMTAASHLCIPSAIITLDESKADTYQRLVRCGANLDYCFLAADFDGDALPNEVTTHQIRLLILDHIGKLAERHPAFGPNSQGDNLLWGRLIAPFTELAHDHEQHPAVVLLDQARRSDGKYSGAAAKAGSVDLLCELIEKDGGLICSPRGRVHLPPFRVDLDGDKCPVFSAADHEDGAPVQRANLVTDRTRVAVLEALQMAEPEGLTSTQWKNLAMEVAGIGRSTFMIIRRAFHTGGLVSHASKLYRVTSHGARWLAERGTR